VSQNILSTKTLLKVCLAIVISSGLMACETFTYYQQAVRGQLRILFSRQEINQLLQQSSLPEELRQKLVTVLELREFAEQDLLLPADGSYLSYVELDREHMVWNVFAAPEFSLEPLRWCFPIAGCVSYRGYFSEQSAHRFASKLEARGYDVYTGGVDAYSTLGWFDDPLPSTVINRTDYQLASLIFHELAHQLIYIPGDTTFNESFATTIEREGLRRWLRQQGDVQDLQRADADSQRQNGFIALVTSYQDSFERLYDSELSDSEKRLQKLALQDAMRVEYEQLKLAWDGNAAYDRWFANSLNNAQLSTVASYNDLVTAFQNLLGEQDADLKAFYSRVRDLAALPKEERDRAMADLH
jgi:predicted aminopeptidase